jgi:O-antigen/teichoic acid export membrane protein
MPETGTPGQEDPGRHSRRFFTNVLWSWLGVAVNLFIGLILSPYIIRTLGEERYGIWALVFALLDYFWFFDLGLNTAIVNFAARFEARHEPERMNQVVNTGMAYFAVVSAVLGVAAVFLSRNVEHFFRVSAEHRDEFARLLLIVGVNWALLRVLHIFISCLDGLQRFDLTSRVWVCVLLMRSVGSVVLLKLGYGLVEMGIVSAAAQSLGYILNFLNFRHVFPELRLSRVYVKLAMMKEMAVYGIHSFLANSANLLLNQGAPVMIGYFLPPAFVGYYTLPSRLLQYAVDGVSRVGNVTRSNAAALEAAGRADSILMLGIYSNRYCFALFTPLTVFLLIYGRELIGRWINPVYALHSAPLLPVLAPAIALVMAGQFNSSAILFGINKHRGYARAMMLEAAGSVVGMAVVIPRFGILGAAWVTAVLMILSRGLYTPLLVCRSLKFPWLSYMREIYLRPVATAIPVAALAYLGKSQGLYGRTWPQLIAAGAFIAVSFYLAAYFTTVEPGHRRAFLNLIPGRRRAEAA